MDIKTIVARQILDSRGNPTVEVDISLDNGGFGRAAVPSGASTGEHEAHELRDNKSAFHGKSILGAINNIQTEIAPKLIGLDATKQRQIDQLLIGLDGTTNKSKLGANAILGVSMAVTKAAAAALNLPLYAYISQLHGISSPSLPKPMVNIVNGGQHAAGSTEIQEFMIIPQFDDFSLSVRCASEIFQQLKNVLNDEGLPTSVGDEGGFVPGIADSHRVFELILNAISQTDYTAGEDVTLGLDVAASEFYSGEHYEITSPKQALTPGEMIDWVAKLQQDYPLTSIEDPLDENDWDSWAELTSKLENTQIVGDDLLVTNTERLRTAIKQQTCNAILIKPNQIGTVSETLEAIKLAQENNFGTIVSHRSGETEDTFIAHLAVGTNAGQIKTGSVSRGERTAKYNELLRIAETL